MTLDELIVVLLDQIYNDEKPDEEQCLRIYRKISEVINFEEV